MTETGSAISETHTESQNDWLISLAIMSFFSENSGELNDDEYNNLREVIQACYEKKLDFKSIFLELTDNQKVYLIKSSIISPSMRDNVMENIETEDLYYLQQLNTFYYKPYLQEKAGDFLLCLAASTLTVTGTALTLQKIDNENKFPDWIDYSFGIVLIFIFTLGFYKYFKGIKRVAGSIVLNQAQKTAIE